MRGGGRLSVERVGRPSEWAGREGRQGERVGRPREDFGLAKRVGKPKGTGGRTGKQAERAGRRPRGRGPKVPGKEFGGRELGGREGRSREGRSREDVGSALGQLQRSQKDGSDQGQCLTLGLITALVFFVEAHHLWSLIKQ